MIDKNTFFHRQPIILGIYLSFIIVVSVQTACQQRSKFPEVVSTNTTEIADGNAGFEFEWLPEGQMVAYLNEENSLLLSKVDGTNSRIIASAEPNTRVSGPQWSPDGTMLSYSLIGRGDACIDKTIRVFSKLHFQPDNYCPKLMIYNVETNESQVFPTLSGGLWSPNGDYIAAGTRSSGFQQIVVLDLATGETVFRNNKLNSVLNIYSTSIQSLAWSPNSQYLVYAIDDVDARDEARIANIAQGGDEIILDSANSDSYVWSPDSQELVYFRVEEQQPRRFQEIVVGNLLVHIYSLDSNKVRILDPIPLFSNSYNWPVWSPDGRFLAFTGFSTDITIGSEASEFFQDLILVDVVTGKHKKYKIANLPVITRWLKWSQDGHSVYISGDSEIVEVSLSFE